MKNILSNYNYDTTIKRIFIFQYFPKILKTDITNRSRSSILYILKGKYHYKFQGCDFIAQSGETVYLPQGGTYSYEILSTESEVMQVEYVLEEKSDTETKSVVFSNNPILIRSKTEEIKSYFEELLYYFSTDKFVTISKLYDLICLCKNILINKQEGYNKDFELLIPVIQYIENHITEKIYLEELADIAKISQSHLRRLFSKNLGMSPIKYKNSILIKCACNMLLHENMNVSETANALCFADVYTFSQFFKKEKGISPKKYVASKKSNT